MPRACSIDYSTQVWRGGGRSSNLTNHNVTSWPTLIPEPSHRILILILDVARYEEHSGMFTCGPKAARCWPPEDVQG